jgi:hypothetical protein
MKYLRLLTLLLLLHSCEPGKEGEAGSFPTHFEESGGKESATYRQVIDFYIRLAREFPEINIHTIGETDSGRPLHIVTYNPEGDFNFEKIRQNKLLLLINNGIHPGESDGIDATMLLYRDLVLKKIPPPENVVLVTIPVYNIGGALNRNSTSRVNQNGPESYGFRGNARNYDLNRDFIKNDTRNAKTFARIYHTVKPDIFVDNHVSNGADYQYTLTQLLSQQDKLGEPLGSYLISEFLPGLQDSLAVMGRDIIAYVNVHERPPDHGFAQFMDTPRYSTGYTALWSTIGVAVETHMLKPYRDRVLATYDFLYSLVQLAGTDQKKIKQLRKDTRSGFREKQYYPLAWSIDSTLVTPLEFKGYKADTLLSKVTGLDRLKYDRNSPFTKAIPFYSHYKATDSVEVPEAYIVKKSWSEIMEHMGRNGIQYRSFEKDTSYLVESYRIDTYSTVDAPYEGHYLHFNTSVIKSRDSLRFEEGDFLIPTDQPGIRYLLETLEPAAVDSFFNWNFFDTILQQKEGFSSYVFQEVAAKLLEENEGLMRAFQTKKETEPVFAADANAQLNWIYKRSPHYEATHLQYPVYRVLKKHTNAVGTNVL